MCLKAILFFWCVSIDAAKQIKTYRVRYIPFGIYMCDCVRTRALSCIVLFVLFIFIYLFTFFFRCFPLYLPFTLFLFCKTFLVIHAFIYFIYSMDVYMYQSVSIYIIYISQAMHIANVMIKKCVL